MCTLYHFCGTTQATLLQSDGRKYPIEATLMEPLKPLVGSAMQLRVVLFCAAWVAAAEAAGGSIGTFDATHCSRCDGLKYCTAMNDKLFFDPVYGYTRACVPTEKQGVCEDLDAKTLQLSKFGDQFQFKDTAKCRSLVWNYRCLSWVTAIFQRELNGVAVSCVHSADNSPTPLPPCRSLCVEVADKCVYSHFYRMYPENVCGNVPCVSEEEEQTTANSSSPKKQPDCVKAS